MIAAGWVAIGIAIVSVITLASLALLYVVGGPFGTLNDAGNALIGVLSAALAFLLVSAPGGWVGVLAAVVGASFAVWGSWLVITGTTGFVLAGFVSTIGFGFIGIWLAFVAWAPVADPWFGPFLTVARIAAVAMIVGGLAAVPAALMRIDSFEALPGWLWTFGIGWIGTYLLYPIVAFGLGRRLLGG